MIADLPVLIRVLSERNHMADVIDLADPVFIGNLKDPHLQFK